ncbi:MAG TPA: hypothetical protein DCY07_07585, partial [Rhodospirillaceae bacterium]|nr:hypothetical protein [Rhodospirillaceae bacterium]
MFAQRPVRSDFGRRSSTPLLTPRRVLVIFVLLVVAIVGGIMMNVMGSDSSPETQEAIPNIQAEMPIKQRPDDPGGLDIPHQDVTAFQQLDEKNGIPPAADGVEQLLPAPETPQAAPAAPVAPTEPAPVAATPEKLPESLPDSTPEKLAEENLPPAVTEAAAPAAAPVSPVAAETPKTEAPAKAEVKQPVAAPVAKKVEKTAVKATTSEQAKADAAMARLPKELFTTGEIPVAAASTTTAEPAAAPAAVKTATTAPVTGKMASVQLASYPDQTLAQGELKKFQSKYAGVLGGTSLRVVRADLG